MIIAAVGMPGAGKSVFCDRLKAQGLPVIYFGGLILEEVERRGLQVTAENERAVREDLRASLGMDAMAQLALPALRDHHAAGQWCGIDGLYSFSEWRTLKAAFDNALIVVAIVAPAQLRYVRLARRPVRPLTHEEALGRDISEIEKLEKGGPIAIADRFIVNDRDIGAFTTACDELIAELIAA